MTGAWRSIVANALSIGVVAAPVARASEPVECGSTVSAEAAALRVNAVRRHGARCPGSSEVSTAPPVAWNDLLADVAKTQATEMARLDRMSHRDSRDRGLGERLRAAGYRYATAAENLAVGYATLDDAIDAWLESEGHCENLFKAGAQEFGAACVDAGRSGHREERRYWALVIGAPAARGP